MELLVEVLGYEAGRNGCFRAALRLERENQQKLLMYRTGILEQKKGTQYIHEVADITFAYQIPSWRKIDSEKDFGFSPEVFWQVMKQFRAA